MSKARATSRAVAVVKRRVAGHATPARPPSTTDEVTSETEAPAFEPTPNDSLREDSPAENGEDSPVDSSDTDDWLKSEQPTTP